MIFRPRGVYWCVSAGPYDCICKCGHRWEYTSQGYKALLETNKVKQDIRDSKYR